MKAGWLAISLVSLALVLVGCGAPPLDSPPDNPGTPGKQTDKTPATRSLRLPDSRWDNLPDSVTIQPLPAHMHRGVCISHSHQRGGDKGYGSPSSLSSKKELQKIGVNWISVTRFGWMSGKQSTEVVMSRYRSLETETNLIRKEVNQARELGMKVMLKPHLWLGGGDWRGDIAFSNDEDWEKWFQSYTKFIVYYATVARDTEADALVFGVEFARASRVQRTRWLQMIAAIREVYKGPLVYAANWDNVKNVVFWDKVDWMGVQYFAPLTSKREPTYEELADGVKKYLSGYEKLAEKYKKPLVMTEFGFRSTVASFITPYLWPQSLPPELREYDELAQAISYAAFLNTVSKSKHVKGVYLWKWFTDMETDEEGKIGFSPFGKFGLKVLSSFFLP